MAYPTLDVEIYECETCGGLWLRTPALGYMKNLRENKAKELAPDLRL
jgi:Zn-finger nucleic acid-binding protein